MAFWGRRFSRFHAHCWGEPRSWWQILSLNKDQVLGAAGHFESNFKRLIEALVNDDRDAGLRLLRDAAGRRIAAASESCIRAQINEFEQHPGDYHRWPQRLR